MVRSDVSSGLGRQKSVGGGSSSAPEDNIQGTSVWTIIFHPSTIPTMILQSVAGHQWLEARKTIHLFPLRFHDESAETLYEEQCNKAMQVGVPFCAMGVFIFAVVIWVLTAVGSEKSWLDFKHTTSIMHIFHAVQAAIAIIQLILVFSPQYNFTKKRMEVTYYVLGAIASAATCGWSLYGTIRLNQVNPIDYTNPFSAQTFLDWKLYVDCMSTATLLIGLIHCDVVLQTFSARSVWYHFVLWMVFTASRVVQNYWLTDDGMKKTNFIDVGLAFLLYLTGWGSRWFRELQDRAVMVRVKVSQESVDRVRLAQKSRRRRQTQSAAEELIGMISLCEAGIEEFGGKDSLNETRGLLKEVMNRLTQGDQVAVKQQPADAEEMEEEVFINMYKIQKKTLVPPDAVGRKSGSRKISGVSFGSTTEQQEYHNDDAPINMKREKQKQIMIGGAAIDDISMANELRQVVGIDYLFPLLTLQSRCSHLFFEVGWFCLERSLSFLNVTDVTVKGFLKALEMAYWAENPYHSAVHAANVAHCGLAMLHMMEIERFMSDVEHVAFPLAALGHDVGHNGRTNHFHIHANAITVRPYATSDNRPLRL